MRPIKTFAVVLSIAALAATAAAAQEASLTVAFAGVKAHKGKMMGVLFDSQAAYDGKGEAVRAFAVAADGATIEERLPGLKPGRYAIRVFHDLDGDGKMGLNPFGVPTEPFAFSNDAKGMMGPASWDAAAFEVKAGDNVQTSHID